MSEQIPKERRTIYTIYVKRFLDFLLSGTAIVALSPLFMVLCLLELMFHGSPVVFAQERPGLHGELFKLYKFRSMTNETDENGNLLPSEKRLTSFGRFIRRYSLDELPELFCIFTGKMSIIGPRPLLKQYLPLYTQRHFHRHDVRPGFACVPLKPVESWTWNDQFENDIWYVENCSFWTDVKMVFAVIKEVLKASDTRANDTRVPFLGNNLDDTRSKEEMGEVVRFDSINKAD